MGKKDIQTRNDIHLLVTTFYEKVKIDDTLGPFFSGITNWEEHNQRLTTFWESSLFLKTKYYGNPLDVHVKVDKENDHGIDNLHFGIWLNHWYQTIDDLFEGDYANNAKRRARKMGTFLFLKIFEARQQ